MQTILPDFSSLRILVLGDVMTDRYLHGSVDRISPEAPVPVMRLGREDSRLGGAANVALNLLSLGAQPLLAGVVGADEAGKHFRQLLEEKKLPDHLVISDPGRTTTVKTRLVSGGQQLLRVDREDTHPLAAEVEAALTESLRQLSAQGGYDLLLLQDYNKGVLTPSLIRSVAQLAHAAGIPTVVDPKAHNFWAYQGVSLFKPNLREMQQQCDFPVLPELASLDRAAQYAFDRLACGAVMITLSEHGIYVNDGTSSAIYPTSAQSVADVSGAGDTVISVAACALGAGMSLPDIARLANLAGAQVIAKSGVVAVQLEELTRAFQG
ncbi:bifunctional ADP-heptose synthase [Neolewinella lacunae]|uniref:bifunctional heptose 7-phosphate kinase/heptose 1-phosphate adenyltransferase n=1 Tax=Neolewinella lacunae TaxID=1517758 RepID=UPI0025B57379|nr:bifunctional ADP-heptose synthase [Neolewinella lacunae]MDN3636168.1 bifunctional ADP-heptose synthase [Neolewinella lacunae]